MLLAHVQRMLGLVTGADAVADDLIIAGALLIGLPPSEIDPSQRVEPM